MVRRDVDYIACVVFFLYVPAFQRAGFDINVSINSLQRPNESKKNSGDDTSRILSKN